MLFNPIIFFPMLIATITSLFSMNLTSFVLERPLSEMIYYLDTFMTNDFLLLFLNKYLFEIFIMLASGFIVLAVSIIAFITLANYAKTNNLTLAINTSIENIGQSISLTFFIFIISTLVTILFSLFITIMDLIYEVLPDQIISVLALIIIPIMLIILFTMFLTKLFFVIPATIDNNIKNAIKKSWDFTTDKFWKSFVFILVLLLIGFFIITIFTNLGLFFELSFITAPIGEIITMTFIGLALSYYYFN